MYTWSAPVKSFSIAQNLAQRGHPVGIGPAVYIQRRLADPYCCNQIVLYSRYRQRRKPSFRFLRRFQLMPLLLDKKQPNQEHFEQIVSSLGIGDKLDALPGQLSGGQQQRTAIARSLIYRPALLLADEPTGNLDRKNSREIVDLLKLSNRNLNQTIILITHDEKIALSADRVVTIEDGRIVGDRARR